MRERERTWGATIEMERKIRFRQGTRKDFLEAVSFELTRGTWESWGLASRDCGTSRGPGHLGDRAEHDPPGNELHPSKVLREHEEAGIFSGGGIYGGFKEEAVFELGSGG